MVASSLKDDERGLLYSAALDAERLLPATLLYGANASGKSNLLDSLAFMRRAVLDSHRLGTPGGGVQRKPFALDNTSRATPSKFDIDFVVHGIRYHYGFEANDEAYTSEGLYAFPNNHRQKLFERTGTRFSFGRNLRGHNELIRGLTRANSLFLSAAAQNDHKQILAITEFFSSIHVDTDMGRAERDLGFALVSQISDKRVMAFLGNTGTGIVAYKITDAWEDSRAKEIYSRLVKVFAGDVGASPMLEAIRNDESEYIKLGHEAVGADPVFFTVDRESAGTRRMLALLGPIFRALDHGGIVAVDELNAHLHTKACEAIVALFSDPQSNPAGAQLIATTHDTNLLSSSYIRRDQVWLVEKDGRGASHLYPLTDIRTRAGDNIEKGYLQGRFGAVPFAGPVPALNTGS